MFLSTQLSGGPTYYEYTLRHFNALSIQTRCIPLPIRLLTTDSLSLQPNYQATWCHNWVSDTDIDFSLNIKQHKCPLNNLSQSQFLDFEKINILTNKKVI